MYFTQPVIKWEKYRDIFAGKVLSVSVLKGYPRGDRIVSKLHS